MTERRSFPGISPRAYEHPADRAALVALRRVPGFDTVVRKLFGSISDRSLRLAFLASAVRVGPKQFPDMHTKFLEACSILDVDPVPELYVAQTPIVNAGAIGVDRPFIVVNSGSLVIMDPDELQFILAHELGHVLSGHVLYKTMLRLLMRMTLLAFSVPLGGAALFAVTTALLEWDRKSELSADRAGLLAVQDPDLALRVMMKMAGGGNSGQMDLDSFLEQAAEYESAGNVLDGTFKLLNLLGRTHPFPVLRLAEMKKWVDSGAYEDLLGGEYARREGDEEPSVYEEIKSAGSAYEDDFDNSDDPLTGFVKGVGRGFQNATDSIADGIANLMGWGKQAKPAEADDEPDSVGADDEPDSSDEETPEA